MLKIDLADFCRIVNGHIAHAIQLLLLQTKYSVTVAVRVTVNLKPDLIGMINIFLVEKLANIITKSVTRSLTPNPQEFQIQKDVSVEYVI